MASAGASVAADERAELEERARVEQVVDAGAGVELALAAVLGQPFLAAHRARRRPPLLEVGEAPSQLSDPSNSSSVTVTVL